MNKDQARGKFDQMKGEMKEEWGKATGNEVTELEGKADRLTGKGREVLGDIKGAVNKAERDDMTRRSEKKQVNRKRDI